MGCVSTKLTYNTLYICSCFIGEPVVFFVAFLAPILVVFLFNCVIFVLVLKVLIQHAFTSESAKTHKDKRRSLIAKQTKKLMTNIFGIMSLFGLTWIFGAFTISGASTTFQYLFAICNSLQGFMLFIFLCVLPKDARNSWIQLLCCCKEVRDKLLSTSGTTTKSGKSGIRSTNQGSSSISTYLNALRSTRTQSEMLSSHQSSGDFSSTVPHNVSLAPLSEVEQSEVVETIDHHHVEQPASEVIANPGALQGETRKVAKNKEQRTQKKRLTRPLQ